MQFEGSRRSSHVPNLTPLIDIVFLLLIFFMLTSQFVQEDALDIQLPETESAQSLDDETGVEIVIDAKDNWIYAEGIIEKDTLLQVLQRDLVGLDDKRVRIRGDKSSHLKSAVTVLDIARKAGASGVDIITENR